jgi:hypothetical protein
MDTIGGALLRRKRRPSVGAGGPVRTPGHNRGELTMCPSTISYADVLSKQVVENWGDDKGFDAEETIATHMAERFQASAIHIVQVKDEGDNLIVCITTELWEVPKEFALLSSGSLVW